jgi:hypothetical protein
VLLVLGCSNGKLSVATETLPGSGRPVPVLQEVAWSFRSLPVDVSVVDPTTFCAAAPIGFTATVNQGYALYAFESDKHSGQVTKFITNNQVGNVMACLGAGVTADGIRSQPWYARLSMVSGEHFEGLGQCVVVYSGSPEVGTSQLTCFLKLTILPAGYKSGVLVANTLSLSAYPRGYNASSLATLRAFRP